MGKIEEFSDFMEESKGHLTVIGVFAALTYYFFLMPLNNENIKSILEGELLPGITFLIFIFLSLMFLYKIFFDKEIKKNYLILVFKILFACFTFFVSIYFIKHFIDWVKNGLIIGSFLIMIFLMGEIMNYFMKEKRFWFNLYFLMVALIFMLILRWVGSSITNYYMLVGILVPFSFLPFVTLIVTSLNILKIVYKKFHR